MPGIVLEGERVDALAMQAFAHVHLAHQADEHRERRRCACCPRSAGSSSAPTSKSASWTRTAMRQPPVNGGKNATSRAPAIGASKVAVRWSTAAPNAAPSANASACPGLRPRSQCTRSPTVSTSAGRRHLFVGSADGALHPGEVADLHSAPPGRLVLGHVAQPGAQVVVAGDQGQSGGHPDQHQADMVTIGGTASPSSRTAMAHHLGAGLPFGELAYRQADAQLGQELAQARDQDLARQDDQRRQHVHAARAARCSPASPAPPPPAACRRSDRESGRSARSGGSGVRSSRRTSRSRRRRRTGSSTATAPSRARARSRRPPAGSRRCAKA